LKIYTKTGDAGETGLIGGRRIPKYHDRIIAYGSVDESNSSVGMVLAILRASQLKKEFADLVEILIAIQNDLFVLGADLADPSLDNRFNTPRINEKMITRIENFIDRLEQELTPISFFILPGGNLESAQLHLTRSITRRTEISVISLAKSEKINPLIIIYLNRLSDLFFVMARIANKRKGIPDSAWK
jgi:cob(I)alamin adenosyltransferase